MTGDQSLKDMAKAIAIAMGKPWKFNGLHESYWTAEIIDGAGKVLLLSRKGKSVYITGLCPMGRVLGGRYDDLKMGVSPNRCPIAVARDIERRLLPRYVQLFNELKANQDLMNKKAELLTVKANALITVGGGEILRQDKDWVKVKCLASTVEIKGSMIEILCEPETIDEAIKIVAFIQSLKEKKP